jgi:hypothetical protein
MTGPSTPAAPATTPADDPRALIVRQLQVLGELAELGLELARAIARPATADGTPEAPADTPPPPQPAKGDACCLAFARAARAVRLTIALQSRLIADLRALDEVAERHRKAGPLNATTERKLCVRRIVQRVIDAEIGDEAEYRRLAAEARERLEHDEIYGDVLSRPVGELITLICRDLGLSPDWGQLAQEAWAQDEIASGQVGSPFIPPRGRRPEPPDPEAGAGGRLTAPQAASP